MTLSRTGWHAPVMIALSILIAVASVAKAASIEDQVRTLDVESGMAQKDVDSGLLEKLLSNELVYVGPDGALRSKQDFLAGMRRGVTRINKLTVDQSVVRVFGNTAIATGRTFAEGTASGARFVTHFRYVKVFVLDDEKWSIVSWSVTPDPSVGA